MTIRYRTDGDWGTGTGANLEPAHVDENFYTLDQRVETIEALPPPAPGIDYFIIEGDQMIVVMEDATTRGPYTLPVVSLVFKGEWQPATAYLAGDIITAGSAIYVVLENHTSDVTFDPGANDGAGNDYYGFGLAVDGVLPTGGAAGMWLRKATAEDFVVEWASSPVPTGGTTGQVLTKSSDVDDDTGWADIDLTGAADAPPLTVSGTTLTLTETNVQRFHLMTNAAGCEVTIPPDAEWAALTAGQMFHFRQCGGAAITFTADTGVTLEGIAGFDPATGALGAVATLYYAGSDVWYLYGLLEATTA